MLIDISRELYRRHFRIDSNPFISEGFIELVEEKASQVLRLVDEENMSIGLILGLKKDENILCSPFSAPFGGFHYKHEYLSYDVIYKFLSDLKKYVVKNNYKEIKITLPPNIYQKNMNAKLVNAFVRSGYFMHTPEIGNWMHLQSFDGRWVKNTVGQNCRRAIKNELTFHLVTDMVSLNAVYDIILQNRSEQDREIHMSLNDLLEVNTIFPVDFFLVKDKEGISIGSGVFYRGHEKIVQGIFVGDDMRKRHLWTIDFFVMNIYEHYKKMGFEYIDLGISSFCGEPNVGLIRFKEIHNCQTSLRYTFSWKPEQE